MIFELESQMIPVLRKYLSEVYSTNLFLQEFRSGHGIADLVFTTEADTTRDLLLDYDLLNLVLKHFNRKNKRVKAEKIFADTDLTKAEAKSLVDFLISNELVEEIDHETFLVKKRYTPPITKLIAIEAKLSDWKNGFYQALR